MTLQRVDLHFTQLLCIAQSEGSGGSEPYLWTTFFAYGSEPDPSPAFFRVITPAYDAFRAEFPNGVKAGQSVPVPVFVSSASFDIDMDGARNPKIVGCIAVLMEEDDTPQNSIVLGRIAYSKAIEEQLNTFASHRASTGDFSPPTDAEIEAMKKAVISKVKSAIASDQHFWNVFRDQDDNLGFSYRFFVHDKDKPSESTIQPGAFEIDLGSGNNRFTLSGQIGVRPVPVQPVDLCAGPRAALEAKKNEIAGLQGRVTALQYELNHATPQQKSAIVSEIQATNALIDEDEAGLPDLEAALKKCQDRFNLHDVPGTTVLENF